MNNSKANNSIKCSVSSCAHATKECACTECASYEMSKQKSGF